MNLIDRMIARRSKLRLSCRALAKILGVSFSTIARLERGEGDPDKATAERIARWLKTGEASAPPMRSNNVEGWRQLVERRLDALEKALSQTAGATESKSGLSEPVACEHRRYTESPNGRVRQCRDCYMPQHLTSTGWEDKP